MIFGIYLGTVVINWGILIKEFSTIKNKLISEGYIFLESNKLSSEYIICIIQFMLNTIIPIFNIFNIISIVSMKHELYNLIKTILLLENKIIIEEKNEQQLYIENMEKNNIEQEKTKISDKIQKLKDEKNKLLGNTNEKTKNHVLTKHHQTR